MQVSSFSEGKDITSNKLDKVQLKALKMVMGYRSSTPSNVVFGESKIPPLKFRIAFSAKNFIMKALTSRNHPIIPVLTEAMDLTNNPININRYGSPLIVEIFEKCDRMAHLLPSYEEISKFEYDYSDIWFCPDINVVDGRHLTEGMDCNGQFQELFQEELQSSNCVFTDGSRMQKAPFTGYALCSQDGSLSRQMRAPGFLSSFCVEIMAILTTIEMAINNGWESLTVFSDSMAALKAIELVFIERYKSYLILKIKSVIKTFTEKGSSIKVIWVPGHVGVVGNERADSLAKDAIRSGLDSRFGVPLREIYNKGKEDVFEELIGWCHQEGASKGTAFCENYLREGRSPWFWKAKLPRKTITVINRLRSGHTSLRESLFKFHIVDSPMCLTCNEIETPNHVFWDCNNYVQQRLRLTKNLIKVRGHLPHPVEHLMTDLNREFLNIIDRFIKSCDLKI